MLLIIMLLLFMWYDPAQKKHDLVEQIKVAHMKKLKIS